MEIHKYYVLTIEEERNEEAEEHLLPFVPISLILFFPLLSQGMAKEATVVQK